MWAVVMKDMKVLMVAAMPAVSPGLVDMMNTEPVAESVVAAYATEYVIGAYATEYVAVASAAPAIASDSRVSPLFARRSTQVVFAFLCPSEAKEDEGWTHLVK
jgi:hypothetical protein